MAYDTRGSSRVRRSRQQERIEAANETYAGKEADVGAELLRNVEKQIMLRQLDFHWKEHLAAMDHLRQGIGLRSYAQKNPKQEYKREAFEMFTEMLERINWFTEEEYRVYSLDLSGLGIASDTYSLPRMYGVTLDVDF